MKIKSEKIVYIILSIINVLVFTVVIKNFYGIVYFTFKDIIVNISVPLLLCLGIYLLVKGKEKIHRVLGIITIIVAMNFFYLILRPYGIDFFTNQINKINLEISKGNKLEYFLFKDIFVVISLALTLISMISLYIFPFNILILDFILIIFLQVADFDTLSTNYIFNFTYIILLSIIFYRNKSDVYDNDIRYESKVRSSLQVIAISIIIFISLSFINLNKEEKYLINMKSYISSAVGGNKYIAGYDITEQFGLKQTGFSDSEAKLGGDISVDNTISLRVNANSPLYLRGSVKYKYLGDSWERYDLAVEDNKAPLDINSESLSEAVIFPEYKFTSALFNTIDTKDVVLFDASDRVLKDRDVNLYSLKEKHDLPYKVLYSPETDLGLLETDNNGASNRAENENSEPRQNLNPNRTENITDRTREFALSLVTEDMSDIEKAEVIQNHLKTNYEYSLTPGDLGPGEDFVENFLYENKEGYCVHFATSLTVLLNSLDIEARYVEGFKMSREVVDGNYIVRNSDAHAWTEVLIDKENNVWKTFDSTASIREYSEENRLESDEILGNDNIDLDEPNLDNIEDGDIERDPSDSMEVSDEDIEKPLRLRFRDKLNKKIGFKDFTILTLVVLSLFLFLNYITRKMILNRILKSNSIDSKLSIYMRMLEDVYGNKKPHETLKDYKYIIENDEIRKEFERIIHSYYLKHYSDLEAYHNIKDPTKNKVDFKRDKKLYRLILQEYKNKKGYALYILNKYMKVYGFTKFLEWDKIERGI